MILHFVVSLFVLFHVATSFHPVTIITRPNKIVYRQNRQSSATNLLCSPSTPPPNPQSSESEKTLRNELAAANELVDLQEEITYSYSYGEGGEESEDVESSPSPTTDSSASTADSVSPATISTSLPPSPNTYPTISSPKIIVPPKLLKERPYPLFLLEKAADVADEVVESLTNALSALPSDSSSIPPQTPKGQKEKVVVLGTGWGAASYLKTLDAEKYDVTVVSPRNFFLFTPMLAGAAGENRQAAVGCRPAEGSQTGGGAHTP
jgi:hypothetical protein